MKNPTSQDFDTKKPGPEGLVNKGLRKAFDTVCHKIVLDKVWSMGITGTAYSWICSYLSHRQQFTCVGECKSELTEISTGVPQGSLLGVLLFQIVVNDLKNCLSHCSCLLYADDTTIYVIGKNLRFLRSKLESDLMHLSIWLRSNKLLLNVKKTKFILFKPKNDYNSEIVSSGSSTGTRGGPRIFLRKLIADNV